MAPSPMQTRNEEDTVAVLRRKKSKRTKLRAEGASKENEGKKYKEEAEAMEVCEHERERAEPKKVPKKTKQKKVLVLVEEESSSSGFLTPSLEERRHRHYVQLMAFSSDVLQELQSEVANAGAGVVTNRLPDEEEVGERLERAFSQLPIYELSSKKFREIDTEEVLPEEQFRRAVDVAQAGRIAEALTKDEHADYMAELVNLAREKYKEKEMKKKKNNNNSEDEDEDEEEEDDEEEDEDEDEEEEEEDEEEENEEKENKNGFIMFPVSSSSRRDTGYIQCWDNYPGNHDVLPRYESELRDLTREEFMKMDEDYPANLFGMRRAKNKNYSPDSYCEPSETWLSSAATYASLIGFVESKHIRYCDVAPFRDGTYSEDNSCKAPKIMKDAGEFTFTHYFNSRRETRADINFIRANNTMDAFVAAVKKEKMKRKPRSLSLFKMERKPDEKTGLLFAQEGAGVFLLRERNEQDEYYFSWYFVMPSPTASTKKLVLREQTDALLQTLSIVNEFIRLLGGKPWGDRINPLVEYRGSGNPLRGFAEHHVQKYAEEENKEEFFDAEEAQELEAMRQA